MTLTGLQSDSKYMYYDMCLLQSEIIYIIINVMLMDKQIKKEGPFLTLLSVFSVFFMLHQWL